MPAFNPRPAYHVVPGTKKIMDFHRYAGEFVLRPPYQRKTVWSAAKQQDLLDSLIRRYYIPRIVLREIRLDDDHSVQEVIDGQQRISTIQAFYRNDLRIPKSLGDLIPDAVGLTFDELDDDVKRFIDDLHFDVDTIHAIDDPKNRSHQKIATDIFWRLQQGESLNYMEIAHARLDSLVRNFVVKYADDQTFDYDKYQPINENRDKHPFFRVINRSNDRMQHLALLTRFLIFEEHDGPADIKHNDIMKYIDSKQVEDGVANFSLEHEPVGRAVLSHMNAFYDACKNDPMVEHGDGMKELSIEYFIISMYLLLRHVTKYYVWGEAEKKLFRSFIHDFYARTRSARREEDRIVMAFSEATQQSAAEIATRDRSLREAFFTYVRDKGHELVVKDTRRAFNEAERIAIYRRDNGLCQACLAEGKPEEAAVVPWQEYQADHVLPHARGGRTDPENGQVLCALHNRSKGARIPTPV